MREDSTVDLFAKCYGLALGLALGAAVCSTPPAWREIAASACWMGDIEAGPSPVTACVGVPMAGDPAELIDASRQVAAVVPRR